MNNSFELLVFLKQKELLKDAPQYWWPSHGGFETLVGAILTQNTKWTNVEKSIANLTQLNLLNLEAMAQSDIGVLTHAITPSGFKNQKSKRLKLLCNNILETFETFEQFQEHVSKEWLLSQKGIGLETADAILCYCCCREEMVVDKYTQRLVETFGYTFESYEELKAWCEYGINENFDKIVQLYGYNITLNQLYCRFHGKIVEFMKTNPRV